MDPKTEQHMLRLLHLTREMLLLADRGDEEMTDDSCGILFGIVRDAAYRLRALAEAELEKARDKSTLLFN